MKKQIIAIALGMAALWSNSALAYLGPNDKSSKPKPGLKANCSPATAKITMEFNDVKALIEQGEDVGLATVYRVLTQFEQAGIVERHNFENNLSVFEIAQDKHHDHLVCDVCGSLVEFHNDIIENEQLKVAEEHGFKLSGHSLVLYGICNNQACRDSAK